MATLGKAYETEGGAEEHVVDQIGNLLNKVRNFMGIH
jgi:hypothetical protein